MAYLLICMDGYDQDDAGELDVNDLAKHIMTALAGRAPKDANELGSLIDDAADAMDSEYQAQRAAHRAANPPDVTMRSLTAVTLAHMPPATFVGARVYPEPQPLPVVQQNTPLTERYFTWECVFAVTGRCINHGASRKDGTDRCVAWLSRQLHT